MHYESDFANSRYGRRGRAHDSGHRRTRHPRLLWRSVWVPAKRRTALCHDFSAVGAFGLARILSETSLRRIRSGHSVSSDEFV